MGKSLDIDQKRELVREWDLSGLTSAEFARSHGVSASALMAWGREFRGPLPSSRRRPVQRTIEVVEVQKNEGTTEPRIEISLASGSRLTLFGAWTPELVAELARALEEEW